MRDDKNIRGLQVAMNDALLVGDIECAANLRSILQRLMKRQRPLLVSCLRLLDHRVVRPDVVQSADVGMVHHFVANRPFPIPIE